MKNQKPRQKKETKPALPLLFFFIFSAIIILILPVVTIEDALSSVLMPRLLIISVLLIVFCPILFQKQWYQQLETSILRLNIFPVLVGYALITFISMSFAINCKESFFDILKTFAFVAVIVIASILFIKTGKWQGHITKMVILAALIACLNGFFQYYTNVVFPGKEFMSDGRKIIYAVTGFMAHKNLFSISLMMMFPFVIFGVYQFKRGWKILATLVLIMLVIMIVLLQTRAAWVGLAMAMTTVFAILVLFGKKFNIPSRWRYSLGVIGLVVVGVVAAVLGFGDQNSKNPYVRQIKSITNPTSEQNIHRLKIWASTGEIIKDHPLTGVGAGNWKLYSGQYNHGRFEEETQLNWLRPHNDYLWVFAEKGILGLLLFLAIFGFTGFYLLKVILHPAASPANKVLALLLTGGIIAYMTASVFDFPYERIHHQTFLAIMIACSVSMTFEIAQLQPFKPNRFLVLIPVLVIFSFGAVYSYANLKQEIHLKKAIFASKNENWNESLRETMLAYTPFRTHEPIGYPTLYYTGLAYLHLKDYPNAIAALQDALKQDPYNFAVLSLTTQAYFESGQLEESKKYFLKALEILPFHMGSLKNLSGVYYQLGDYQKSYETLLIIPVKKRDADVIGNIGFLEKKLGIKKD